MKENKNDNSAMTDDEIISQYNKTEEGEKPQVAHETAEESETETAGDGAQKKKRKRGIERHLYPCPHCGEQILDHFTQCPKCGGSVEPRGYHVDEDKRKKIVRVFQIAGVILSVGLVVMLSILLNK